MKRKLALLFSLCILVSFFAGCSSVYEDDTPSIGVFMPCLESGHWVKDAEEIEQILGSEGYEVTTFYANKDYELQLEQISQSIEYGFDVVIIAPVQATGMDDVLCSLADADIKIIAYDRLPKNTSCISYFATFDSYLIGVQQAESLVEGIRKKSNAPYNIEIFTGSPKDEYAVNIYEGSMSVLKPLINSGEIKIISGETTMADACNERGEALPALERMKRILEEYYSGNFSLNGVLSPNDSIALAVISALNSSGKYTISNYPIITGQNADLQNVKYIVEGKQYSTLLKDPKQLAQITCSMVDAILNGESPEINDTTSNGLIEVPSFLCEPILVTKENYINVLVDSGYFEYSDLFPDS
ncbi:MAG: sugar-binding protein [Clostridia bacterium]|nr:sugar-binding protein [Clostridia bacterium]